MCVMFYVVFEVRKSSCCEKGLFMCVCIDNMVSTYLTLTTKFTKISKNHASGPSAPALPSSPANANTSSYL